MSAKDVEKDYAFGRWFGTIGFFLGIWLAVDWELGWIGDYYRADRGQPQGFK